MFKIAYLFQFLFGKHLIMFCAYGSNKIYYLNVHEKTVLIVFPPEPETTY